MPPRYLASRAKTLRVSDMQEEILITFIAYYCPTEIQYYDIHKIMMEMGHTYTENCFRLAYYAMRTEAVRVNREFPCLPFSYLWISIIDLSLGTFNLRNYVGGTVIIDEARDGLAKYGEIGRLEEISRDVTEFHGIDQGILVEFKNLYPDHDIQAVSAFIFCHKTYMNLLKIRTGSNAQR